MTSINQCIHCLLRINAGEESREHILSGALGSDLILEKTYVHRECNNGFGHNVESKFLNKVELFRWAYEIRNAKGDLPKPIVRESDGDILRGRRVKLGETSPVFPDALKLRETKAYKDFRVFEPDKFEDLKKKMAEKYPGGHWEPGPNVKGGVTLESEEPFSFLNLEETYRCAAKYAFNYYAWVAGHDSTLSKNFDQIRAYIFKNEWDQSYKASKLIYSQELLSNLPCLPPNHTILLIADPRTHLVLAIVSLFGLFSFSVALSNTYSGLSWRKAHAFDPIKRKYAALELLGNFRIPVKEILSSSAIPQRAMNRLKFSAAQLYNRTKKRGPEIEMVRDSEL
jgi:hypothetical protein